MPELETAHNCEALERAAATIQLSALQQSVREREAAIDELMKLPLTTPGALK